MSFEKAQIALDLSTLHTALSNNGFGNDGPITMTELFLYVQHNTAARTKSAQIPMLGRMMGGGEMLFSPKEQRASE